MKASEHMTKKGKYVTKQVPRNVYIIYNQKGFFLRSCKVAFKKQFIMKTYLYMFHPLLNSKTGFIGVYIIFLISAQKTDCGYSLEPPRRGGSNEYPQSVFSRDVKNIRFFNQKTFSFWWWNIRYIWIGVFS